MGVFLFALAGCGSTDESRNAARLPGNFEISVDNPYQLQSGPSLQSENVSGDIVAQSFTTNSRPTKITLITLKVSRSSDGDGSPRSLEVRLHSSVGGYPGAKIADLGAVSVVDNYDGTRTVAVASSPTLVSSREYFVVAAAGAGTGSVSVQSAVNAPLSNVDPTPSFRLVRSSTGQEGEWSDTEAGRNLLMTVVVENAPVPSTTAAAATATSTTSLVPSATVSTVTATTQAVSGQAPTTTTTVLRSSTTVDVADTSTTLAGEVSTGALASGATTTSTQAVAGGQSVATATTTSTLSQSSVAPVESSVIDTAPPDTAGSTPGDTTPAAPTPSTPGDGETVTTSDGSAVVAYSPADDPDTTREISAILAAFAALMAAGAASVTAGSSGGVGGPSRARLSTLATKKLKRAGTSRAGAGDAGTLWRRPGTDRVDRVLARVPERIGRVTVVGSRIAVDGSWARAMFGSASLVLWPLAAGLGILWGLDNNGSLGLPTGWVFVAALTLGVLDALTGGIVAVAASVTLVATGSINDWASMRALLGIWVILLSPPLIGNVVRPLRRVVHDVDSGLRERFFDYVMAPVGVAFAIEAMTKALNGLSGRVIADSSDFDVVKITVWVAMIVRLALEDVSVHYFPERSRTVQPSTIPGQTKPWGLLSASVRYSVYLFVSEPFFGLRASTFIAGLLLVVPFAMKPWEDDLPNNQTLWQWLPRGFLRFAILVIVGGWLGMVLLGDEPTADMVRAMTPWLFLPAAIFGIVEYFGRSGAPWPDTRVKRWGGGALWVFVVLVLAGVIPLF